jgi:hypothetical protein
MWLEWFAIPSPFAEGPRVRIRFPPAASPLQTGLPPLEFPPCDRLSDPVGAISARAVVGLRVRSLIERKVNEIRRRFGSTSITLTRTTSPGFAILRGYLT